MSTLSSKLVAPSLAKRYVFAATEGQTLVSPVQYTVGSVDVYLNGVKLVDGDDYTAINSTSITLTEPAVLDDAIEVISYSALQLADTYSISAADNKFLSQTDATSTYLTQTDATSTYLTQTDAASTYLTQTNAASTYLPLTGGTVTGAVDVASLTVNGAPLEAGAKDGVFWENSTTITANYTITSGKNAGTFGPITIADGVTVTIPDGSTWTVV